MTPKKSYSRYFIILQEDEKGYSLNSDKIPSGYAKLEMKSNKCKISYYVQNLRKEKQPYYMILICGKKDVNKIIKLGKLNIDDSGRVDVCHEYDIGNIADTGISADKIIGAAIVKFLDANVISIMSGFSTTDKPNEWKNYKIADCNKEKNETRTVEITNEFDEYEQSIELIKVKTEEKDDRVHEHIEVQKNEDEEAEAFKEAEAYKEADAKLRGTTENVEILDELEQDTEVKEVEDGSDVNRHKNKKQDKQTYPKGAMGDFFKSVAQDFEEIRDFSKEIKWCKWYKVPVNNLENMYDLSDYNKYTIAYYPMICYYPYIRNYKSFMLGYKCDSSGEMKYIVYGIPGSRAKSHQPYGGKTGFVTWISDSEDDEMGHWLMFYDFKKSTIVVPLKK
ncbi:MAG: hypothetical protein ACI8WT_002916 [Clostridium sp.]